MAVMPMRPTADSRLKDRFGFPDDLPAYYSLGLAALVMALDFAIGPRIEFPSLYALPVLYAAWYGGRRWALPLSFTQTFHIVTVLVQDGSDTAVFDASVAAFLRVFVLGAIAWWLAGVRDVQRQLSREVEMLEGLLPICSYCKRIRDDEGDWQPLEKYIGDRSDATFTHGVCQSCLEAELASTAGRRAG